MDASFDATMDTPLITLGRSRPAACDGHAPCSHGEHETATSADRCVECPTRKQREQDLLDTDSDITPVKVHRRFDRLSRLFGDQGIARLANAHVVVVGAGGVGSFAAESLARSAVGRISLVDFDLVCVTNTNRQLHSMRGTIGKVKVEVMAERLRLIHPTAQIDAMRLFYGPETRDLILGQRPTWVIDAIDNVTAKLDLLATCRREGIPIISAMGAAGRMDPTRVRIGDLAETVRDGLAKDVRKNLLRKYGLTLDAKGHFGITAVYSDEPMTPPADVAADKDGFQCVCPQSDNNLHTCEERARIDGSASFVTGAFGLAAAAHVVQAIAQPHRAIRTKTTKR